MINLTALIAKARAAKAAHALETFTRSDGKVIQHGTGASGHAVEGNVAVYVIPVQPRGMSSRWTERAIVYVDGKVMKTAEVKAALKAEAAA